jgi:hypothetical protein
MLDKVKRSSLLSVLSVSGRPKIFITSKPVQPFLPDVWSSGQSRHYGEVEQESRDHDRDHHHGRKNFAEKIAVLNA